MRILYVVTKAEIGGVSVYLSQLSPYFKNKGDEVAVMTYPGGWLENKIKELGEKFYPNKYFKNSINPFLGFGIKKQLLTAIKDFKPDIIHCNSSVAGFWTRVIVKNSIPTVYTCHGWAFTDGALWWRKIIGIATEKITSRYCSKIICTSEYDKNLALKYKITPEEKIITIYNGIDIENWEIICKKRKEEKWKLENTPYFKQIRIVFVARLAMPKDPITLIKAFSQLPESLKQESNIFIVGDGPDREALKKFIEDLGLENKIHLLGGMDRDELKMIYISSDINVLTTNYEAVPYTIKEAMSYGLPVIASNVGGCGEAVDSNCGFLVKRSDVDGVKNALAKLIISKELREKMGKAGYKKAREQFSLEKMLGATEVVYEEVLSKSKVQSPNKT